MISVVCDLNYIWHKTFGVFAGYGSTNPGEVLSSEADKNLFMRKVITDFCYTLNQLPIDGKVILVKDSRSWRKDLEIKRAQYKSSRIKDVKVDWGSFFDLMEEFCDFADLNGYITSRAAGAEGDDLLWFWNEKLIQMGSNVIIFSGDKDSHQLVTSNQKGWTICWNANSKNNKIVAAKGWKESYLDQEEELSVFDISFDTITEKDKIKNLLASSTLEEIDPEKLLFEKILTGDSKDDVPSVWSFEKPDGKIFKLTPSKAEDIYNHYKLSAWGSSPLKEIWDNQDFRTWISGFILRTMKSNDDLENRRLASNNYEENAKLVWLSDKVIPPEVVENMEFNYSLKNLEPKQILMDRKTMISRSKWAEGLTPSKFDPFKYNR